MANINLLPWRAERRKLREREFYMMLAVAAAGAILAFLAAMSWMSHLISSQEADNAYLQQEITALDKKIEEIKELDKRRSQLLTRKEIIEQLQSNRSQMVHLFDEMVKTIPDGARLSTMKQAGDTLTLEGTAESNSRVASYMRNIDNSPWMGRTDLSKIENKAGVKEADKKMPYQFSLEVKLHKPDEAKKAEATKDDQKGDQTDAAKAQSPKAAGDESAGGVKAPADTKMPAAPATTGEKK
ncbi:PilN domain-containing protein [Dokdonella sp.]|uniref:PilN domain-containing protein n=1 Tax=Dokdonella sp. TaxID=2291710 RepID=UPI003784E94D